MGKEQIAKIQEEKVSGLFFEYMMARMERILKRTVIAFTVIIVSLILAFVWYESQYQSSSVTVDGKEGIANYMGDNSSGEITNGSSDSEEEDIEKQEAVQGNTD